MNLDRSIKTVSKMGQIFSLQTEPIITLHIFKESPFILVKDHEENLVKFVLASEVIEYINFMASFENNKGNLKNIPFLEEGTRLKTPYLEIVEKKPKKFKIKYLLNNKTKVEEKTFSVPARLWIKTNKEAVLFFIEKWENEKTVLYQSPFPNTFENGKICWGVGNVENRKAKTADELDKLYFEETVFTADNNRIVYEDGKYQYSSTGFLEKFNSFPDFKNFTQPSETLEQFLLKNELII